MKKTEINFKEGQGAIKFEHDQKKAANPMTADQKYRIALAAIACAAFVAAVCKLGIAALIASAALVAFLAFLRFFND